jgi:Flp pilus assembly protein TadB
VSGRMKFAIAGIVVGLILWFVSPWLTLAVVAAAIAIPVGAYLLLDPSQRRRLREVKRRRQLGR